MTYIIIKISDEEPSPAEEIVDIIELEQAVTDALTNDMEDALQNAAYECLRVYGVESQVIVYWPDDLPGDYVDDETLRPFSELIDRAVLSIGSGKKRF